MLEYVFSTIVCNYKVFYMRKKKKWLKRKLLFFKFLIYKLSL